MKIIEQTLKDGRTRESLVCVSCARLAEGAPGVRIYEDPQWDDNDRCVVCGVTDYEAEFSATDRS